MNNKRQEAILALVKKHELETQEELLLMLKQQGFEVTQATVSRDIKKLRLLKTASAGGKYKYAVSSSVSHDDAEKFRSVLQQVLKSTCVAGNLVIVKTISGAAQAACAAIDSLGYHEIVGSIAGDDTIFLAVKSEDDANTLHGRLEKYC